MSEQPSITELKFDHKEVLRLKLHVCYQEALKIIAQIVDIECKRSSLEQMRNTNLAEYLKQDAPAKAALSQINDVLDTVQAQFKKYKQEYEAL
jgi:hypothetical protein